MSDLIRPVDFSGLVQRSNEVSNLKQNEDNKPMFEQQNIANVVEKDVQKASKEVINKQNADYHQTNYDAKDEGRGQKYKNSDSKKGNKNNKDRITKKGEPSHFDIKI